MRFATGFRSNITLALLACSSPALFAQNDVKEPTTQELQSQLEQRNTLINDLLRRVKQLEYRIGAPPVAAQNDWPQKSGFHKTRTKPQTSPQEKPSAPGTFEVDEKSAERALERTLTSQGALLLPTWSVEIAPSFSYVRNVQENSLSIVTPLEGNTNLAHDLNIGKIRRDEFSFALSLRFGLPFDSQLELSIPYRIVDQSTLTRDSQSGLPIFRETSDTATAFGDVKIGIAKTFLREKNWWPDLVGRVTWDSDTGKNQKHGISLGGSSHELRGSLTAIKRLDPLAFFSTAYYEASLETNDYEAGDQYGFSLGASLATSPETALSMTLQQSFFREDKFQGQKLPGTDAVASALSFGASWIIGRGSLLSISPSIGLTDDTPDYTANLTWSYRLR